MICKKERAILLVSFGTSYEDTRRKNLDRIEEKVQHAFPEYQVYSSWSCERLIRKVQRLQGYHVDTLAEAFEKMLADGVKECVLQPTFVTAGAELERVKETAQSYEGHFSSLKIGMPLLSSLQDVEQTAEVFVQHYQEMCKDACLFLMGHGTAMDTDSFYNKLNEQFRSKGCPDFLVGTIEEKNSIEELLKQAHTSGKQKVLLVPFLLTAGRHVEKDMMGSHSESWKSQLEKAGYEVTGVIKGVGEYEEILDIYVSHICHAVPICQMYVKK